MSTYARSLTLAFAIVSASIPVTAAENSAAVPTDLYGDPLPRGVFKLAECLKDAPARAWP